MPQKDFTGTSLAYTFDSPDAESRKHVQYYEVLGNRGIYKDGWKAVVNHAFSETYADDEWELYHVANEIYHLKGFSSAIRADRYTPVSPEYECPFEFSGRIHRVVFHQIPGVVDTAQEIRRFLHDE